MFRQRSVQSECLLWIAAVAIAFVPPLLATDFGGNLAWSQYVASLALFAACAIAAAGQLVVLIPSLVQGRNAEFHPPLPAFWATGLMLVLLGYALIQTVPVAPELIHWLSPGRADIHFHWSAELRPELTNSSIPISLAPFDTLHAAALLAIATLVSYFSSILFASRARVLWLLSATAFGACSIAIIGIARKVNPEFELWSFQSGGEGAPFGTFLNRNNAALGMNLGIAASIGILVYRKAIISSLGFGADVESQTVAHREFGWLTDPFASLAFAACVVGLLGIVVCGSRGGMLSTVAAGGCALVLLRKSFGRLAGAIGGVTVLVLIAVSILRSDTLGDRRLAEDTISNIQTTIEDGGQTVASDLRLSHWPDGFRAALKYLPMGSGLGTYGYAYLPWQKTTNWRWCVHADNLWLEMFLELGLFGLALLGTGSYLLASNLKRLSGSADPIDQGVFAAGVYIAVAVVISQTFDFGLVMPSNLMGAVLLLAMIATRAAAAAPAKTPPKTHGVTAKPKLELLGEATNSWRTTAAIRNRFLPTISVVAILLLATPALARLRQDCATDNAVRLAKKELPALRADAEQLELRVIELDALAQHHEDPNLMELLSQHYFQLGRLREYESLNRAGFSTEERQELYENLSRRKRRLTWRASNDKSRDALAATGKRWPAIPLADELRDETSDYAKALTWTRKAIAERPLSLPPRADLIRLEFIHESSELTSAAISQASDLFPRNPELSFRFGKNAAEQGDYRLATRLWLRAIRDGNVHMAGRVRGEARRYESFPVEWLQ